MMIDVAYLPAYPPSGREKVCVIIDVIRASSTITYLFDSGTREVWLTDKIDLYCEQMVGLESNVKVCAEDVRGFCLEGADFSPSLEDISYLEGYVDNPVLMQTTNGTNAVHKMLQYGIETILVGCMRNATKVMEVAMLIANELDLGLYIVCAGREYGTSYTIDDVYCAAYLVKVAESIAKKRNIALALNDSAKLACFCYNSFSTTIEAFNASASGDVMRKIDKISDINLCSQIDKSVSVPVYVGKTKEGFLRLVPFDNIDLSEIVSK